MSGLDQITQAAHDQKKRHTAWIHPGMGTRTCLICDQPHPCHEYLVAERVVQLAADVAATHEKIRAALSLVKYHADKGSYNGRPLDALESIHFQAEAILGLLEPSEHTHEETT